ncbi:MAG: hypothetical protein COW58_07215 [Thalassolituus sp. CG17_big_fil_post_rev_8_21_14_2_50_53_8]|nr:MAG: hypothetical protein COW58_07215 [Thalassolituus sp. CG17_big_fil_post_rev_8_21_14_2_50_53_8]
MLDSTLLQSAEVAEHWPASIDIAELGEIFTTHFERQAWLWQLDGCEAEVVLDQGEVSNGRKTLPLCEVELELKQGDAAGLWAMALQLAEQAPLWLSDISKAERGYRLARLSQPWAQTPGVSAEDDMAEALPQWLSYEFLHLQRALEHCLWDSNIHGALDAWTHWQALRALPQLAGKAIRRNQTRALRDALDQLQQPLQQLAATAQLLSYLRSADEESDVRDELNSLQAVWMERLQQLRDDAVLAQALTQAAAALYALPPLKEGSEQAGHWLRHLLHQHQPLLEQLKRQRPQSTEQWRGMAHELALLCMACDYARALPQVNAPGETVWRALSDMLNAETLLQRPWPLPPLNPAAGAEQRTADDYSGWAEEHLQHLARQL